MKFLASKNLDPVTFEVLKNSFINIVDQMAEQVLRTCYSFVIYNRDFANCLHDTEGNCVAQGNQDIASLVGTLHFTCKEVIRVFQGQMMPGDVYAINDPYAGGTHFSDVRLVRPIFNDDELVGFSQSVGHFTDMGGSVPGSFNSQATDMFGEALRITPIRIFRAGEPQHDIIDMIAANTRDPSSLIGDIFSQAEATKIGEREVHRLIRNYGIKDVLAGMQEVQDYVERTVRKRISELGDGVWKAVDHMDRDPDKGEGMVPIHLKMIVEGDTIIYDFEGTGPVVGSIYNSSASATFSAIVSGMKTFFPDLPLNSGFYRVFEIRAPKNSVVSAEWPVAVTAFLMAFEKIVNSIFAVWSEIKPDHAIACAFNMEYLQVGGRDRRKEGDPFFMFYEWLPGGWGGRNGKDGCNVTTACFGTGLMSPPAEGTERINPALTLEYEVLKDSAGPGKWRGGAGVIKTSSLLDAKDTVVTYICDRERAIVWGINGGLPSMPHGMKVKHRGSEGFKRLGSMFSDYPIAVGDIVTRPTAGGGGYGDPLERDPEAVWQDVVDDYVSVERAEKDYGVVIRTIDEDLCEYEIDHAATEASRASIRKNRRAWAGMDPAEVVELYKKGEIDELDAVRRYAVVLDWDSGDLMENSTQQFRESFQQRTAAHWSE